MQKQQQTMKHYVLDNSMALAMVMPDEFHAEAEELLAQLENNVFHVPSLWVYEFSNSINSNIRRKRINEANAADIFAAIETWDLVIDQGLPALSGLASLARAKGLSAYDAAYLELSTRLDLPLKTLDDQLLAAINT